MHIQRMMLSCAALVFTLLGLANTPLKAFEPPTGDAPATNESERIATTQPGQQVYRNGHFGFALTIPSAWKISEKHFSQAHFADVFLTIDNKRADLQIIEQVTARDLQGTPTALELSGKTIENQMLPGEVYLEVAYIDGPAGRRMEADSVETDLLSFLKIEPIVPVQGTSISEVRFSFFKRGHNWQVWALMRDPVTPEDRQKVITLLQSWRFFNAPVNNVAWAESVAWQKLPDNVRIPELWPTVTQLGQITEWGIRSVLVKKLDGGYSVEFTQKGTGTWKYFIQPEYKIIQMNP